ncbi:MAG: hypothetical protein AAF658_22725, partial [Myxococcota bacterium]
KSLQPQSLNPYQYALNNPMRFVDPTGFDSEEVDAVKALRDMGIIGAKLDKPLAELNIDRQNGFMPDEAENHPDTGAAELQNATRGTSGLDQPEFARREAARLHANVAEQVTSAVGMGSETTTRNPPETIVRPARILGQDEDGIRIVFKRELPFALPGFIVFQGLLAGFDTVRELADFYETSPVQPASSGFPVEDSLLEIDPAPTDLPESVVPELPPIVVLA